MRLSLNKNLAPLRTASAARIDAEAENIRGYFITQGSGQAMVYQQKLTEAEMVAAKPNIPVKKVPHITKEAALNGVSLQEQADTIIAMAERWKQASALIEEARMAAKNAIASAITPAEIQAAAAVEWPFNT